MGLAQTRGHEPILWASRLQQPTKWATGNAAADEVSNKYSFGANYQKEKFMLSDTQVFLALFVSLITGVLAVRLGTQLYK
jgi:photosystem I reaction center subunit XII